MTGFGGIIFNPCGTIFNLRPALESVFGSVFGTFGMDFRPERAYEYADTPIDILFSEINSGCTCRFRDFMTMTAAEFERFLPPSAELYPESLSVLDELKNGGCRLGLFTTLYAEQAERLISKFALGDYFASVVRLERFVIPRPNPIALKMCLSESEMKPEKTAIVSCFPTDIETGKNAGIVTILVQRDGEPEIGACEPDCIIRSLDEIPGLCFDL